jgi:cell division protein FtsW
MKIAVTLLVFCVGALVSLGMVTLYSAGMARNEAGAHFFLTQFAWFGIALVACCFMAAIDYQIFRKLAPVLFGASLICLVLVLIPAIGTKTGGARRWLRYAGVGFQPSELAKIALIIMVAWYCERYQRYMRNFKRGVMVPGIIIGSVLGLIFVEPDVGSTILLAGVSAILLLVAGIRWLHFLPPVLAVMGALALFLWKDPMRSQRIYSWLHVEETRMEKGLQAWQAMLAFGSGGWQGLGLGNGRQKFGFVPEHHTDFIFSVIGEELGLIATLAVIVLFVMLVICGVYISCKARDLFGLLLGAGITFMIGAQAFINIGVTTGALPNKGLPLPFISYGGSNLLLMLACVGILISIARHAVERTADVSERFHSPDVLANQMS